MGASVYPELGTGSDEDLFIVMEASLGDITRDTELSSNLEWDPLWPGGRGRAETQARQLIPGREQAAGAQSVTAHDVSLITDHPGTPGSRHNLTLSQTNK